MSNFPHKVDFKSKQAEFSAYIRNPHSNPPPKDVPVKRMQMYRELFFNNVESFLSSNFPVLRTILTQQQWQELAQDFFENHTNTTPYFSEIPEEFILYLQNERLPNVNDHPFMLELAHYEWIEMALSISQATHIPIEPLPSTQLTAHISLSPLLWLLAYQYPVHRISPDYLPTSSPEQPTYLAVYRDDTDEVKFIELAAMSFKLLQTLKDQQPTSIDHCLATLLPESHEASLKTAALEVLQQFIEKNIILVRQE